jgi:hypothetical protein
MVNYPSHTGLICHLPGIDSQHCATNGSLAGQLFENCVVNELTKQPATQNDEAVQYHALDPKSSSTVIMRWK